MTATPNEARHRMSGDNINLKLGHRSMPLIGALCRSAAMRATVTFRVGQNVVWVERLHI